MGFFTKRERNELDRLRERTVHEFVPPHEESNTRQSVPPHQEVRTRREPTAQDLGPLLARASGNSLQQIDDLIDGLQSMRDRLSDEAARVQREMIAYARFSQLTVDSTKVVSESLRNSFPILGPSEEPTLIPSDEGSASPFEQPAVTPLGATNPESGRAITAEPVRGSGSESIRGRGSDGGPIRGSDPEPVRGERLRARPKNQPGRGRNDSALTGAPHLAFTTAKANPARCQIFGNEPVARWRQNRSISFQSSLA